MDNTKNYLATVYTTTTNQKEYPPNPYTNNFKPIQPHVPEPYVEITHSEAYSNYCRHCNLSFDDLVEYEHHNVELHGITKKVLTCHICTASFRRQDHLKRHMQSLHTHQKYCYCPVCGKDCKRQDMLLTHIKNKHTSESDIFKCRDCDNQFNSLTDLEKHENTHMVADRHICPQCNATFKRKDHMLRHIKSQHLNQVARCPICSQVYKRKDHVARHVREKHKMGLLNGKLITSSDII